MILVTGGTGKTGSRVVERLRARGEAVRVGSRRAEIPMDWDRPETWAPVLEGVSRVYLTYQPDLAVPAAPPAITEFVALARAAGVEKVVLLSGRGEVEAQRCERILMDAGVPWTVVRASWFNQNFTESFLRDPVMAGEMALPAGEELVPFVDADDIADVAVEALTDDQHNGQIYELTGPEQLSFAQAAERISQASGRSLRYLPIPLGAFREGLLSLGLDADYVGLICYLFDEVLIPENASVSHDIEKVLGRPARRFADYAADAAARGLWAEGAERA